MPSDQVDATVVAALSEQLSRTMVVRVSVAEILEDLVAHIVGLLPVTGAGVSIMIQPRAPVHVAASDEVARAIEVSQTRLGQGPCVIARETAMPCVVPDSTHESRFPTFIAEAATAGLGAVFAFPLRLGEQSVGAMDLYRDAPAALTEHEIAAASMITRGVSAFLINAQQHSELEVITERLGIAARADPLTQMANRTALSERQDLAIKRWERSRRPFTVLFIDIDDSRTINDRYGHSAGDELLTMFVARLQSAMRPADLIARLRGDEFAVICEDLTDPAEPDQITDRITRELQAPFTLADAQIILRASVGASGPGPDHTTSASILRASDEAMYAVKRAQTPQVVPGGVSSSQTGLGSAHDARLMEGGSEAMGNEIGTWHEQLIKGDATGEVAFSSVLSNTTTGELLITQYNRQAMLLQRYEWQPTGSTGGQLTVSDWDDEPLTSYAVQTIPAPPSDHASLRDVLDQVEVDP